MRGFYSILPTLSPDFSGVCSTLFELGGILAIHDAGGCTGTYTGYDEPRWFDQRSRVFTSNLDDAEAVFGDDSIFLNKLLSADEWLDSKFFALLGSPSPAVLGTDYRALAKLVENRTGKKAMSFPTKGTDFYDRGVSMALLRLAKTFLPEHRTDVLPRSVNLIGATPLDLTHQRNVDVLRKVLEDAGFTVCSVWAMGSTLEEISGSVSAACNIALTVSALPVCRYLESKYAMSWLAGSFSGRKPLQRFLIQLENLLSEVPVQEAEEKTVEKYEGLCALVIGEQLMANSVRESLELDREFTSVDVCTLFDADQQLMRSGDQAHISEAQLEERIRSGRYDLVIGDGFFRELDWVDSPTGYVELPHVAVSSRLGWTSQVCPFGDKFLNCWMPLYRRACDEKCATESSETMCYGIAVGDGIDRRVSDFVMCGALFGASFGSLPNYGSSPLSGWTGIGGVEGGESFWG